MEFHFDDYDRTYVMICETIDEAQEFCQLMGDHNKFYCSAACGANISRTNTRFTEMDRDGEGIGYRFNAYDSGAVDCLSAHDYLNGGFFYYTFLFFKDFQFGPANDADICLVDESDLIGFLNGGV